MSNKTSQLQIRVSPEEKRALKRLAAAAGVTVSRYVMSTVLPTARVELTERAHDLAGRGDRGRSLAELRSFLAGLPPEALAAAVSTLDVESMPPLLRNQIAAVVEHVVWLRGQPAPSWARAVEPLDRPHFARDLPSLRPHLSRAAPVTFKRRNAFVELQADAPGRADGARVPAGLARLAQELDGRGIQAELCTSEGALVMLAFSARPSTRNVTALFQPLERLQEAIEEVGRSSGRAPTWAVEEVRACVGLPESRQGFLDLPTLRVYEARPDYLLAMKCASLRAGVPLSARDDVRHLARALRVSTLDGALAVVHRYFTPRQLTPAAREVIADALGT